MLKRTLLIILIMLIGIMLGACASPPATFGPIEITGSGSTTSPPFTVTTEEWIIDWSYIPSLESPMTIFSFFIYPRGEAVKFVEFAFLITETSGSMYSYAGKGEYYIKVIAANVKSWKVVIEPGLRGAR